MTGPNTILIAEDDPDVCKFLLKLLATEGYSATAVENGRAVWRELREKTYELLITDLSMPEEEGLEVIRRLRAEKLAIKILAISGFWEGCFLPVASRLGANAALRKPFDPFLFLQTVRELIGSAPSPSATIPGTVDPIEV